MKRIGIFGGTFDPVHNGHLSLAEDAAKQKSLEQVIFVPAKLQPFKLNKHVTAPEHRLAMVKAAIHGNPQFRISEYELRSPEISYTCNTLNWFKGELPAETELYFITGTDAFLNIYKWKNAEELLENYSFIVGSRPGYREEELIECIERFRKVYNTNITKIDNRRLDISATEIRQRRQQGREFGSFLPPEVERYIKQHGLY